MPSRDMTKVCELCDYFWFRKVIPFYGIRYAEPHCSTLGRRRCPDCLEAVQRSQKSTQSIAQLRWQLFQLWEKRKEEMRTQCDK